MRDASTTSARCSSRSPTKRGLRPAVIESGDKAPDFSLPDQDGREVKLSDFKGTPVVVYFYPQGRDSGLGGGIVGRCFAGHSDG